MIWHCSLIIIAQLILQIVVIAIMGHVYLKPYPQDAFLSWAFIDKQWHEYYQDELQATYEHVSIFVANDLFFLARFTHEHGQQIRLFFCDQISDNDFRLLKLSNLR